MLIIIHQYSYSTGNPMDQRARIIVRGIVQGVFFRDSTRRKAQEFHVTGTVMNKQDGSVEIVCEGPEEAVRKLIEWSSRGPQRAYVESMDLSWETYAGEFEDFSIVY